MPNKRNKKPDNPLSASMLFYVFFGCLFILLPVFQIHEALDKTLYPRLLILSSVIFLMTLLLFSKMWFHTWDFSFWKDPVFLMLTAYLFIIVGSLAFATNVVEGYFDIARTVVFVMGTAFASVLLAKTENWQEQLSKLAIIAAAIALIIGFSQYASKVILSNEALLPDGRHVVYSVTGMFSHKNIHAAFLFLLLPFTAFGIYKLRSTWRVMAIITSFLLIVLTIMLRSRSVWLGGFSGISLSFILFAFYAGQFNTAKVWRKRMIMLTILAFAGLSLIFVFSDASDAFSLRNRLASIFDAKSEQNIHRLRIWDATISLAKDSPLTGVGAGNWKVEAPKYFASKFENKDQLIWIRPHNDFLWILSEKGVLGILTFLAAFVLVLLYLFRVITKKGESALKTGTDDRVFALFMFAAITTYLVDSLFSFPYERIDIQAIIFIIMAASIVLYRKNKPHGLPLGYRQPLLVAGLLLSTGSGVLSIESIRMEKNLSYAMNAVVDQNWDQLLVHADAAKTPWRSLGPVIDSPEYLEGLANLRLSRNREATDAFLNAYELSPYHLTVLAGLALSNFNLGQLQETKSYLYKIIDIFPEYPAAKSDLSKIAFQLGEYQEAYNVLISIKHWENDPALVDFANQLRSLIESEQEEQDQSS